MNMSYNRQQSIRTGAQSHGSRWSGGTLVSRFLRSQSNPVTVKWAVVWLLVQWLKFYIFFPLTQLQSDSSDSLSPFSSSVVDGQLLGDPLLWFKSVPVHLWLLQCAHLLFFPSNTTQEAAHTCRTLPTEKQTRDQKKVTVQKLQQDIQIQQAQNSQRTAPRAAHHLWGCLATWVCSEQVWKHGYTLYLLCVHINVCGLDVKPILLTVQKCTFPLNTICSVLQSMCSYSGNKLTKLKCHLKS